MLLIRHSRTRV